MTTKKDVQSILLTDLPMPPSSNSQYIIYRRGNKLRHASSEGLKIFKNQMRLYHYRNRSYLDAAANLIQYWLGQSFYLKIQADFYFPTSKLFTKQGMAKKIDVSNRFKALHDCLSESFKIDDSLYFQVIGEKRMAEKESVRVSIEPFEPYLPE